MTPATKGDEGSAGGRVLQVVQEVLEGRLLLFLFFIIVISYFYNFCFIFEEK